MDKLAEKAGYPVSDMGISCSTHCTGHRLFMLSYNLPYDPANVAEAAKVRALATAATKRLMADGAFFSRPYGENSGLIMNRDAANKVVLTKLKNLFDPNKVMNPGKIGF